MFYAGYASSVLYARDYAAVRLLTSVLIVLLVNYPVKVDYTIVKDVTGIEGYVVGIFRIRIIRSTSSITQKIDIMKYPKCVHIKA